MNGIRSVTPGLSSPDRGPASTGKAVGGFQDAWEKACRQQQLKFSRHARERLEMRQVTLNDSHLERLHDAVARAGEKGARESLILLDELALVVSVRNRTVITAVPPKPKGVVTEIDSAVIA